MVTVFGSVEALTSAKKSGVDAVDPFESELLHDRWLKLQMVTDHFQLERALAEAREKEPWSS